MQKSDRSGFLDFHRTGLVEKIVSIANGANPMILTDYKRGMITKRVRTQVLNATFAAIVGSLIFAIQPSIAVRSDVRLSNMTDRSLADRISEIKDCLKLPVFAAA
jgi:hypothetical protein